MNHELFIERMASLGYSRESADDLVWVATDAEVRTQAPFNFVPIGNELYEIHQPDGRDGYFKASQDGIVFVGSLGEAFLYVYKDRADA